MQHHKYSLAELENMIPFEREIYTQLLIKHLAEENRIKTELTIMLYFLIAYSLFYSKLKV